MNKLRQMTTGENKNPLLEGIKCKRNKNEYKKKWIKHSDSDSILILILLFPFV